MIADPASAGAGDRWEAAAVPLILTLKGYDFPGGGHTATLERGRLTIGRSAENDMVLPDLQRVISKQQCEIEWTADGYRLTDTSTNGVFFNAADKPLGRGNAALLKDGDQLRISDYEIEIRLTPERGDAPAVEAAPATAAVPSTADGTAHDNPLADILGPEPPTTPEPPLIPDRAPDPLAGFGAEQEQQMIPADFAAAASEQEFFRPPTAAPQIPEDWDSAQSIGAQSIASPAVGEAAAAPSPAAEVPEAPEIPTAPAVPAVPEGPAAADIAPMPTAPPVAPAPAPAPATAGAPDAAVFQAFLAGAGLGQAELGEIDSAEAMALLGNIYRQVVVGLMEVLAARSTIKSEFRLSQTTIQPAENNPLKFSLGTDDAMLTLLTKRGGGYLSAEQAVAEAFDDIKGHQVAVMAGMQMALKGLLRRFDPKALEQRIDRDGGVKLPAMKKARYWEAFAQLYEDLVAEAEDDFDALFGKEFAKAYEQQVSKQGARR